MPSPPGAASKPDEPQRPELRDRWLFRVLALLAVLVAAVLATRSCASSGDVTQDEAVAIAIRHVDFEPECFQVRFLRIGLNSTPLWAVSLWTLDKVGGFKRIAVVQVNAVTSEVVSIDRDATSPYTQPQCASPT